MTQVWDKEPGERQVHTFYDGPNLVVTQGIYCDKLGGFVITQDLLPAIQEPLDAVEETRRTDHSDNTPALGYTRYTPSRHSAPSREIRIYIGRKRIKDGFVYPLGLVYGICQDYCNKVGLCVRVAECRYIYTDGSEDGVEIGLIRYPRFPDTPINRYAEELAKLLMEELKQCVVSIVFPEKTVSFRDEQRYEEYHNAVHQ